MTKYFVNQDGAYIGAFDGAEPPSGAIEVPTAPAHAADRWTGAAWVKPAPTDDEHDAPLLTQLREIDIASIRPLRENDVAKLASLNGQSIALRAKLKKPK